MKVKGDEITEKSQGLGSDKSLLARHKPQRRGSRSLIFSEGICCTQGTSLSSLVVVDFYSSDMPEDLHSITSI